MEARLFARLIHMMKIALHTRPPSQRKQVGCEVSRELWSFLLVSTCVSLKELVVQPPTITSQPSFINSIPTFWTAQSFKIAKWWLNSSFSLQNDVKSWGPCFEPNPYGHLWPYDVKILNHRDPYKFKRLKNNKNHRETVLENWVERRDPASPCEHRPGPVNYWHLLTVSHLGSG